MSEGSTPALQTMYGTLLRERDGMRLALANLVSSLRGRAEGHRALGYETLAEENMVALDAIQGILDHPTAALS